MAKVDRQNKIVQNLVGCMRRPGFDIINGIFPLIRRSMSSKDREKSDIFTVISEILEVAKNPNPNKNRGSTVRGDRWFELHVIEY